MQQKIIFQNEAPKNVLTKDGTVFYSEYFLEQKRADNYFLRLSKEIEWKHDEIIMFGKKIVTQRKVAWYGDEGLLYSYSNTVKTALPWTTTLLEIKQLVEDQTNEKYNSCLLNFYQDGSEGMGWHSDNEKELKKHGTIASVSLGANRKFSFKHNETKEKVDLQLHHGSCIVMKGKTQTYWKHQLPKSKKVKDPRINLTFRFIDTQ
ncbi:alpha-ketoglutarate-dependent dioxygenase AlkB [Brumimicrobium salinarum]|uniref:Alpha-ketoglutarate-dependent dioxygenase AlkB n=1 Tax=Brumimicrobium salinarum TaxID=2058658 RepID=A0A2I0QZS9_9FLAO|nr:alpha-ketoglutarate-dependent dioxygenase AlkB [Brumimicrobium salinarum]PKR79630.1 alpha-ketoglutarate-dependent dioxygenase AlkB [Brumimicrobium salinarum]